MSDIKHAKTPWKVTSFDDGDMIHGEDGWLVETVYSGKEIADHIVKCVNTHDALVDALKAYREAYSIGQSDKDNDGMCIWCEIQDKADAALKLAGIEVTP